MKHLFFIVLSAFLVFSVLPDAESASYVTYVKFQGANGGIKSGEFVGWSKVTSLVYRVKGLPTASVLAQQKQQAEQYSCAIVRCSMQWNVRCLHERGGQSLPKTIELL